MKQKKDEQQEQFYIALQCLQAACTIIDDHTHGDTVTFTKNDIYQKWRTATDLILKKSVIVPWAVNRDPKL